MKVFIGRDNDRSLWMYFGNRPAWHKTAFGNGSRAIRLDPNELSEITEGTLVEFELVKKE